MGFLEDIKKFQRFAEQKGVGKTTQVPFVIERLYRFGFQMPPAVFWKVHSIILVPGICFGVIWGALMYFAGYNHRPMKLIVVSTIGGIIFGVAMATFVKRIKAKLGVTTWEEFKKSSK